jgi:hypothetical protein
LSPVSHQTIKLSKGKHASPENGACVMELASMLAGERFTDHPRSVSRVIAAFLRGYNDLLDEDRRQDLYVYASRCVGTAGSPLRERARVRRLTEWGDQLWDTPTSGSILDRVRHTRARRLRTPDPETAATYALRALTHARPAHHEALALIDELIEMEVRPRGGVLPALGSEPAPTGPCAPACAPRPARARAGARSH